MPDQSRRPEDRPGGHENGDDAREQLDDETTQDHRLGTPRIAHGAAEQDQPRRSDRCQEDEGLES